MLRALSAIRARSGIPAFILCVPLFGCSGTHPTGPSEGPTGVPAPPPPVITSLTVSSCPTKTLAQGTTVQLAATANLSDDSVQGVTT
jgi:hypothetical protein